MKNKFLLKLRKLAKSDTLGDRKEMAHLLDNYNGPFINLGLATSSQLVGCLCEEDYLDPNNLKDRDTEKKDYHIRPNQIYEEDADSHAQLDSPLNHKQLLWHLK